MTNSDRIIVVSDLGGGGAQNVIKALANHWAENGLNVTVITLSLAENDRIILNKSINRIALNATGKSSGLFGGITGNLRRIFALRNAIKKSKAKTVISFIGTTNILTILACMFLKKTVIISERNDPAKQSLGRLWDFLRKVFYKRADVVTANSKTAVETMKNFVPEHKLAIVPNPVIAPDITNIKREKILLAVGRLHHQKAYDVLLPAFANSEIRKNGWKLVILGEGSLRDELEKQTHELGLKEQVIFKGFVPDTFPYYLKAKTYVLPSRHEGMPNALLEAAVSGVPAVVSDACTGVFEILEHKKSCLMFPSENVEKLTEAIDRLAKDEPFAKTISEKAKSQVQLLHDCNKVWQKWEDVICTIDSYGLKKPSE
ncbi:MAG: glycosyltransferase [Alphaproteobacteria bacterium]|nr:glycosyltransferase [Alphaproteobacteria bacterium]